MSGPRFCNNIPNDKRGRGILFPRLAFDLMDAIQRAAATSMPPFLSLLWRYFFFSFFSFSALSLHAHAISHLLKHRPVMTAISRREKRGRKMRKSTSLPSRRHIHMYTAAAFVARSIFSLGSHSSPVRIYVTRAAASEKRGDFLLVFNSTFLLVDAPAGLDPVSSIVFFEKYLAESGAE